MIFEDSLSAILTSCTYQMHKSASRFDCSATLSMLLRHDEQDHLGEGCNMASCTQLLHRASKLSFYDCRAERCTRKRPEDKDEEAANGAAGIGVWHSTW